MARMNCESFSNAPSRLESDVLLQESSVHHHHHHLGSSILGTRDVWLLSSLSEHRCSRLKLDVEGLRDRAYRALFLSHRPSVLDLESRAHGLQEGLQEGPQEGPQESLTAGSNEELLPLFLYDSAMAARMCHRVSPRLTQQQRVVTQAPTTISRTLTDLHRRLDVPEVESRHCISSR